MLWLSCQEILIICLELVFLIPVSLCTTGSKRRHSLRYVHLAFTGIIDKQTCMFSNLYHTEEPLSCENETVFVHCQLVSLHKFKAKGKCNSGSRRKCLANQNMLCRNYFYKQGEFQKSYFNCLLIIYSRGKETEMEEKKTRKELPFGYCCPCHLLLNWLKPRAKNSIQVPHMCVRDLTTWTIISASWGMHRKLGSGAGAQTLATGILANGCVGDSRENSNQWQLMEWKWGSTSDLRDHWRQGCQSILILPGTVLSSCGLMTLNSWVL